MIDKDRNGLKDIYTAYAKQIYRVILGIVRSHEDAEDLTSDFFLKLWNMAAIKAVRVTKDGSR